MALATLLAQLADANAHLDYARAAAIKATIQNLYGGRKHG